MIEDLLKVFQEGGYPLLFLICSLVANVTQWRDRQKVQTDLLAVNKNQHAAQVESIKILTEVRTKVDKCDRDRR